MHVRWHRSTNLQLTWDVLQYLEWRRQSDMCSMVLREIPFRPHLQQLDPPEISTLVFVLRLNSFTKEAKHEL